MSPPLTTPPSSIEPDKAFNDLARLATLICNTLGGLITVGEAERQQCRGWSGPTQTDLTVALSFCAYIALHPNEVLVVPDVLKDKRFRTDGLTLGEPVIRFFAGAPLLTKAGDVLGTLVVFDTVPRGISSAQCEALETVCRAVINELRVSQVDHTLTPDKPTEEKLPDSENTLNLFIDYAPAAIAILDREMRYLAASRRYLADYRLGDQTVLGRSHYDLFPEIPDHWKDIHRRCLQGAIERSEEDPFPRADGTLDWVRWEIRPWHASDGAIGGLILFSEVITERKQAELALAQQTETLREYAEMMEHAQVLVTDLDDHIVLWSKGMEALYGWTAEEAVGQITHTLLQTQSPVSLETYASDLQQIGEWQGEVTRRRKDGATVVVASHRVVHTDAAGRSHLILEVDNDLTKRKQAEDQLHDAETLYRTLFELSLDGLALLDAQRNIILCNRRMAQLYGYESPEAMVGLNVLEFVVWDEQARLRRQTTQPTLGQVSNYEYRLRRRDGSEFVGETGSILIPDQNGQPSGLTLGVVRDITARKQQEAALREREQKLSRLLEILPVGVSILDAAGQVAFDNPALEKILRLSLTDLSADKLKSRHYLLADGSPMSPDEFASAQARRSGQAVYDVETGIVTEGGETIWTSVNAVPVDFPDWKMVVTVMDITQRKLMEDDLRRSNTELEQFAYVASHDLQEPLRAVTGMVQLLQQRYRQQLDERGQTYIHHAVEAASRMQTLINDLLAFSRVGRQEQRLTPIALEPVLASALSALSLVVHETEAVITHDPLPTASAEPTLLGQVFQNLIGNAIKFRGAQPPRIHISVEALPGEWRFAVHDNGIGIEPQYFDRIFLIFQRLHTRQDYPGNGIGLALCQKIVHWHGGRMWVASVPQRGSVFFFTLPKRYE